MLLFGLLLEFQMQHPKLVLLPLEFMMYYQDLLEDILFAVHIPSMKYLDLQKQEEHLKVFLLALMDQQLLLMLLFVLLLEFQMQHPKLVLLPLEFML
jgi:hypothetical protein